MPGFLRQATASQARALGPFIDSSDFVSTKTGLTIANTDIKLVVNGGASANKNSGGGTHRVNGVYGVTFDATDTATVGEMEVSVVVSGALPVFDKFTVVEEAVYDALFVGSAPGYVVDQPVNATKIGGTSQTGRDLGASVLLSSGTGTGQLDFTSGVVKANAVQWLGGTIPAVNVTGVPLVDLKYTLGTISPATAGSVRADAVTGAVGSVTGNVGGSVASVTARVTANTDQLAGQTVTAAAGVTFPTSVASPTNITAGTITTTTNLTNAPTSGDFTATMKTSIGTAVAASAVASVTGNVGGNVGGNVTGSVGSVASGGIAASSFAAGAIDAAAIATDAIGALELAAGAASEIATAVRTELTTELGRVDVAVSSRLASASYTAPPTAAANADAVWDETLSDHLTSGSTGAALNAAGSAGDPWSTALPGSYGSGTAGKIVGDNINATISSRAAASSLTTAQADLDDIQTRLPGALVGGRMDSSVGAVATGAINAAAIAADAIGASELAADAVSEIAAGVRTELATELARVDVAISTRLATAGYTAPLDAAATRAAVGLASANLDTQLDALPTNAELATALGTADDAVLAQVALVKAKTDNLPSDPADASDIAASFSTVNSTLATIAGYIDTEVATLLTRLGTPAGASIAADIAAVLAKWTTAMTESYAAAGATMTPVQALHMIVALLSNRDIIGTTLSARKLDGTTAAATFTLDSGTAPTSQVRAT